jgi:hypothetical protein
MKVLTLFTGMLIGAGAMIWFYSNGGEISVAGQQWGPAPKAVSADAGTDPGLGKSKAPAKPRMVIRDITEGAPPSSPEPAPVNEPPPAKSNDSSLIEIKWPLGTSVTKFP